MKRFDFEAVRNRMISRLRVNENWALVLGDGTIGNIIDTIADGRAEDARYMEYLFHEKKWKTAMNMSSLQADGDLIGYKRNLPQSAIGYILVSHTDEEGNNRLENYGNYFFDVDAKSDYDDLEKDLNAPLEERTSLVPWICDENYIIPKNTRFIASNGIEFFSIAEVTSKTLKKPWSAISSNGTLLKSFYEKGGWNGIKYSKVPVIQGIQRRVSLGKTKKGIRNQSFKLPTLNVEAGINEISCRYFSIEIITDAGETIKYIEIPRLGMASAIDNVFEKSILKDESGVKIKFGNGINGNIPPEGVVWVNYIETLGINGNITAKYQINTMVFPGNTPMKDPRTNQISTFLHCTNISPLLGGKDIESVEEFKENAPTSYLKSYTIATNKAYLEAIKKYSPLSLLHIKMYPDSSITSKQINGVIGENVVDGVLDELTEISDTFNVTALLSNGEIIPEEEVESSFINPLQTALYDVKGPSDIIKYVAPNLIEVAPSIKVTSSNVSFTQDEIKELLAEAIANEYDIYNQDFNEPFYESKINSISKMFPFSDTVSIINEAVAKTKYDDINMVKNATVVSIPFEFDVIYSTDLINDGFKDCTVNSDYLIKVDMQFINDASKVTKNRTFFLYDDREDESGATTIKMGKNKLKEANSTSFITLEQDPNSGYVIPKADISNYNDYQVRVAQFDFINEITDASFMTRAKDFSKVPLENRVFDTAEDGSYEEFYIDKVQESLRSPIPGSNNRVYKRNLKYIDGVDIDFTSQQVTGGKLYKGSIFIPLSYFDFSSISSVTTDEDLKKLRSLMKQYVSFRVYAQPKMTDFLPKNVNDIIFINKDYVKVEKIQTYN